MKFRRDNSPATLALGILLPVLLIVLAMLQYHWLTEISWAERERLLARLQTDARRFAQDFNAEIAKTYFIFYLDARVFETGNSERFAERFDAWTANAAFPNIIAEIYFADERNLERFNPTSRIFEIISPPAEIDLLREHLLAQKREGSSNFAYGKSLIDEQVLSLTVPIFRSDNGDSAEKESSSSRMEIVTKSAPEGFVIIKFNRAAITGEMLPELIRRNFAADAESYDFRVSRDDEIVFQSAQMSNSFIEPDAAAKLFDLSPETTNVVVLNGGQTNLTGDGRREKIIRARIDRPDLLKNAANENGENQASPGDSRKVRFARKGKIGETAADNSADGVLWILSVQHKDGSLENFVGRTKWRNLGLSFSILSLLGASVILLLISAQRSKLAARRQFDFVSSVSHEFRTPVAVIRSAGANLARGIVRSQAQVEKYGNVIERESNRIGEMVEQILEFAGARSNRKNYVFQPVEIVSLVEQALAGSRPLLEQNEITVEKHLAANLPFVNADAKSLRQALENLVGNAVKYSGENRLITISAFAEGEYVAVAVEDRGIGIDAKELRNIFEPFYRGRFAVASQIHGNGLGLSLVKEIVAAHEGKISVESKIGAGSKFTIKLPAQPNGENQDAGE